MEWERLVPSDNPIETHIPKVARVLAGTCSNLGIDALALCFGKIFRIPAECRLFDHFKLEYASEVEFRARVIRFGLEVP